MRFNNHTIPGYFILSCIVFCSCQKVINVHLNDSSPQYVVEGNISDQPGVYTVSITKSINFDQDNVYPAVSGALVVITDRNSGIVDSLSEVTAGHYVTSRLKGIPGDTYDLYIKAGAKILTATSTMPLLVILDSLSYEMSSFGRNYEIVPIYTDPIVKGNYYHFREIINDSESTSIYLRDDRYVNGQTINQPLDQSGGSGQRISLGDNVSVYLECIDSAVYQYYYGLQQTSNQNSASPSNPATNITGGCLGYFSAHTSSFKNVIVH